MSTLEKSVKRLAGALDALEARLEASLGDQSARAEAVGEARARTRTAKTQASAAAEDLSDAIRDLKALLSDGTGGR
jgi:hypothetical protein